VRTLCSRAASGGELVEDAGVAFVGGAGVSILCVHAPITKSAIESEAISPLRPIA
jgi:hypothetical protein